MARVAILGSAFNPPHRGHIHLVEVATQSLCPDKVLLVPTAHAPHKTIEEIWGYEIRALLAGIAFCVWTPEEVGQRLERLKIFDKQNLASLVQSYQAYYTPHPERVLWEYEKEQGGTSYTIDTLRAYKKAFPQNSVLLLIGADQASSFETWKEYKKIFELAEVWVATRQGEFVFPQLPFHFLPFFEENISSSTLREAWKRGENMENLLPPPVGKLLNALRSIQ